MEQNQIVGELVVRWMSVTGAKSYVLQCAEVVPDQEQAWSVVYTGGKFNSAQKPLAPGKTCEFRVAAIGCSTGQSDWSPPVQRMAA